LIPEASGQLSVLDYLGLVSSLQYGIVVSSPSGKEASLVTSQGWFRRVGFVSGQFKVTPAQIAKMDKKQAADFLLDIIGTLDKGRIDLPRS
jgi:hypothetical protein